MSEEDDRLASFTGQEASGEISGDQTREVEDFDQNENFDKKGPITDWEKQNTLDC